MIDNVPLAMHSSRPVSGASTTRSSPVELSGRHLARSLATSGWIGLPITTVVGLCTPAWSPLGPLSRPCSSSSSRSTTTTTSLRAARSAGLAARRAPAASSSVNRSRSRPKIVRLAPDGRASSSRRATAEARNPVPRMPSGTPIEVVCGRIPLTRRGRSTRNLLATSYDQLDQLVELWTEIDFADPDFAISVIDRIDESVRYRRSPGCRRPVRLAVLPFDLCQELADLRALLIGAQIQLVGTRDAGYTAGPADRDVLCRSLARQVGRLVR